MTRAEDLIASITVLNRTDLEIWLREELVTATADGETLVFTEMECARVRLICSLRYELEVETETLPVVMSGFITDKGTQWDQMTALGVITVLPVLVFALLVQRYLVRGLTLGAVKE